MKTARWGLLVLLLAGAHTPAAWAGGTPPCTEIVNQATATYTIGATTFTESSNEIRTTVAQLVDVSVVWQDASNVTVRPAETFRILTFRVTNTGNADDSFSLAVLNALSGDDFDPIAPSDVYLDANGNGIFDTGIDQLYTSGPGDPSLAPDSSVIVFVRNSIPVAGTGPGEVQTGDLGSSQLTAASNTATGNPGDSFPHPVCTTDIVIGGSGGDDEELGTYVVSTITLTLTKTATISDPFGNSDPVPGAVITYTITANVTGTGTAENVVITDPIPIHTTYNGGSLQLNAASLTDPADADAGDVGGTTPNTVTVSLGNMTDASPPQIITFVVTID